MARKAKSCVEIISRLWECRTGNGEETVSVSTTTYGDLLTTFIAIDATLNGGRFRQIGIRNPVAFALCDALLAGKDVAAILADAVDESEIFDIFGAEDANTVTVARYSLALREANVQIVKEQKKREQAEKRKADAKAKRDAMKFIGLKHVRGNLGGSYWE